MLLHEGLTHSQRKASVAFWREFDFNKCCLETSERSCYDTSSVKEAVLFSHIQAV